MATAKIQFSVDDESLRLLRKSGIDPVELARAAFPAQVHELEWHRSTSTLDRVSEGKGGRKDG